MTAKTVPWWHLAHRWSKWQRSADSENNALQIRECVICGKAEVRFL